MKTRPFFYSFKTKVTLVLILAMIFVTGLNNFFVYRFNLAVHFEELRNSLIGIAQMASLGVDTETLLKIPLTWEGVKSPAYRETALRFQKVLATNKMIRYIYVLEKTKTPGKLRFLIDTEAVRQKFPRKRSFARPGDVYDASGFPEMLKSFTTASADRAFYTDPWGVTLSGYAPILDKTGNPVAILGVDILADDVQKMQQEIRRRMMVVVLLGILFCCVLGILVSGSVSGPVQRLAEGTRELAEENLDYRVTVRSRDEIGELAASFNKMAASLSESRRRLRDYFFKVTRSLVRALEAKDAYTQGHSERVGSLACKIALELGLGQEKSELIRCLAELHDLGKLVIRTDVLNKKEKLDPAEWEMLKEHPVTGERILEPILEDELLRVIRSHHERVDGKGYPDGLEGDAIDLSAQIVSIADAYDAMTSARPYRKSLDTEVAINEIKRARGTQFRPDVVSAFLRVITQAA